MALYRQRDRGRHVGWLRHGHSFRIDVLGIEDVTQEDERARKAGARRSGRRLGVPGRRRYGLLKLGRGARERARGGRWGLSGSGGNGVRVGGECGLATIASVPGAVGSSALILSAARPNNRVNRSAQSGFLVVARSGLRAPGYAGRSVRIRLCGAGSNRTLCVEEGEKWQ